MDRHNYRKFYMETINTYPKYVHEDILDKFIKENIVSDNSETLVPEGVIDVSGFSEEKEKNQVGVAGSDRAIKILEEFEFLKSYKHSVIFSYNGLKIAFEEIVQNGLAIPFDSSPDSFEKLEYMIDTPVFHSVNAVQFLKFNFAYSTTINSRTFDIKYPILVVFFQDISILEIRFDRINNMFKNNDPTHYKRRIATIKEWLTIKLGLELTNIDMSPIIEYIKNNKSDEVKVQGIQLSLRTGQKTTLNVGTNSEYVLPLLGGLEQLIIQNETIFKQAPYIKELLDSFILDIKETSDSPWTSLCWVREKKKLNIIVKFSYNYMNEGYTLLQYLGQQRETEMMDYVTKYLIASRDDIV